MATAAAATRPRGNKARLAAVKTTEHAGRKTVVKPETSAQKMARVRKAAEAGKPVTIVVSGPKLDRKYFIRNDYTARVSHRCRTEIGMTPEMIMGTLFHDPARVSADTLVAMLCFAKWQAGEDCSYSELLDTWTVKQLTGLELEPEEDDRSPED